MTYDKLDEFTRAYIECALWSSTGDDGDMLDKNYGIEDVSEATGAAMIADCEAFQRDNEALLSAWYEAGETPERAGHDFWLTRNGHGAGFWDRFSGNTPHHALGEQLSDKAHTYGSADLYVGDDGQVHAQ
jgi:hypothetical protein